MLRMKNQSTLFPEADDEHPKVPTIPGLQYIPEYLTERQESWLIGTIEKGEWLSDLQRKVQHFGYRYSYKLGDKNLYPANPFPEWAKRLGRKLREDGIFEEIPDQLIINDYQPGQGIAHHIDREELFGDKIVSISLLSPYVMEFLKKKTKETRDKMKILLEPRSALVISGEARHEWLHGIPGKLTDEFEGEKWKRGRRISLTFRNVKLED